MLGDGMADYPVPSLGDRTPLEAADKPMMDWLSKNGELGLRCFFVMAIHAMPYMKKGMQSGYRDELEQFLSQYIQRLFERVCDEEGLYRSCTRFETSLILRYHTQGILGLLRSWTESDTKNLDEIVHTVFRLMTEGISPVAPGQTEGLDTRAGV